jgi:hypothetical protein
MYLYSTLVQDVFPLDIGRLFVGYGVGLTSFTVCSPCLDVLHSQSIDKFSRLPFLYRSITTHPFLESLDRFQST